MKKKEAKNKKKVFSLKQEYKKSFQYIKDSKNFIYSSILIFAIFSLIGFFFDDVINILFRNFLGINLDEMILDFIEKLLERTKDMSQKQLIGFIFVNNLQSSFLVMVLGSIFGVLPLISAVTNGYLLGFVAWTSVKVGGFLTLWKILPHGVFELPAVFISLGLGFRLGAYPVYSKNKARTFFSMCIFVFLFSFTFFMLSIIIPKGTYLLLYYPLLALIFVGSFLVALAILTRQDRKILVGLIKNSVITFLLIVVPLLIIAALIEGSLIALGS